MVFAESTFTSTWTVVSGEVFTSAISIGEAVIVPPDDQWHYLKINGKLMNTITTNIVIVPPDSDRSTAEVIDIVPPEVISLMSRLYTAMSETLIDSEMSYISTVLDNYYLVTSGDSLIMPCSNLVTVDGEAVSSISISYTAVENVYNEEEAASILSSIVPLASEPEVFNIFIPLLVVKESIVVVVIDSRSCILTSWSFNSTTSPPASLYVNCFTTVVPCSMVKL